MNTDVLVFTPLYMERVWGDRKLESLFGRKLPPSTPIGESWELVDRQEAQSVIADGDLAGSTLHHLWTNHREEFFGKGHSEPRFPILIKILDAAEALSVQVHPPALRSSEFDEEPKAEMWYFADCEEGSTIYAGLKNGVTKEAFKAVLQSGNVADLLYRLTTKADDFIFLHSGRLHAIGGGNVIFEIQQNSDTTYRVFDWNRVGLDGVPRELHQEESLRSIDFNDFEPRLDRTEGENLATCDYFKVDRWKLKESRVANSAPGFSVFQVVNGRVAVGARIFYPGDLFLVPAFNHLTKISAQTSSAEVLRTTLPRN